MAIHRCHNATSNNQNSSSSAFVPIIGLSIAGASLVYFILMIWVTVHGIYRRRLWLPCRWLSLNALTLTLLSTAAKLPMDITTQMPGAWDQLSKVTGTGFICVSMGFLMPSLGCNSASQSVTNMGALSIFVFFMLVMLCFMWLSTWGSNMTKETQMDRNKDVFRYGKGSVTMLRRLQLCYLHGYNSDPQVLICRSGLSHSANVVCLFCFIVVLQVSVRTFFTQDFRYCNEVSAYGWSVRIIVATQILVILLAVLSTSFRGAIMSDQFDHKLLCKWNHKAIDGAQGNDPYLHSYDDNLKSKCIQLLVFPGGLIAIILLFLPGCVVISIYLLAGVCFKWRYYLKPQEGGEEYKQLLRENDMEIDDWTLTRFVYDMKRWMHVDVKNNPLSDLKGLLSKMPPSKQSLEQLYMHYNIQEGNKVSILHLVFLQRIASVSLPSSLSDHLTHSLNVKVFYIIHSMDTKINSSSFTGAKRCRLAKAMWMGQDFRDVGQKILKRWEAPSDLDRAVRIISELKNELPPKFIWNEVSFVMEFINIKDRGYLTIEELSSSMEQLFVDMLHMFLMQIPEFIYKEVTESPPEKHLNKVRRALKLVSQVKSLDGLVQWSFPNGCNITSLMPASTAYHRDDDEPNVVDKV